MLASTSLTERKGLVHCISHVVARVKATWGGGNNLIDSVYTFPPKNASPL